MNEENSFFLRYGLYLIWAVILSVIQYLILGKLVTLSFYIIFVPIVSVILFLVEAIISKSLYINKNWWDWGGGFFDQQITCRCSKCKNWRKTNWSSIYTNRILISLFLSLPFAAYYLNISSENTEEIRIEKVEQVFKTEQIEIETKVDNYFDSLKLAKKIPQNLNPEFAVYAREGELQDTIIAEYSYTTDEIFEGEVLDFCPGCYLWSESVSASNWLFSMDKILNNFLLSNLEKGESVHVSLIGYSDGIPVTGYIPYKDDFGSFPRNVDGEVLTSYILNDKPQPIRLKKGDKLGNPEIAFLRAFSIREYLDNYVEPLVKVKKNYAFYAYTQENPQIRGGNHRKVKLILKIINVPKIVPPVISSTKVNLIEILGLIISLLIIPFLGKIMFYHYEAWRDAVRSKETNIIDRNLFFVYLALMIILLFIILTIVPNITTIKIF